MRLTKIGPHSWFRVVTARSPSSWALSAQSSSALSRASSFSVYPGSSTRWRAASATQRLTATGCFFSNLGSGNLRRPHPGVPWFEPIGEDHGRGVDGEIVNHETGGVDEVGVCVDDVETERTSRVKRAGPACTFTSNAPHLRRRPRVRYVENNVTGARSTGASTGAKSDDSDNLDSFTTCFRQLRVQLVEEFRKLVVGRPPLRA